jgi:hypothetical protein
MLIRFNVDKKKISQKNAEAFLNCVRFEMCEIILVSRRIIL